MTFTMTDAKPIAYFLAFLFTMVILNQCAYSYWEAITYPVEPETASWYSKDYASLRFRRNVYDYLCSNGCVSNTVSNDDFDYICELALQLSEYYDNVPWNLTLAVISVESSFDTRCEYEGALGLMQLLPSYHQDRLVQCLEEDERYSKNLFYDPRLNIMTGLDYLSQLINECNGDVCYALMCYNQGPSSAHKTYVEKGIVSDYAKEILELSDALSNL